MDKREAFKEAVEILTTNGIDSYVIIANVGKGVHMSYHFSNSIDRIAAEPNIGAIEEIMTDEIIAEGVRKKIITFEYLFEYIKNREKDEDGLYHTGITYNDTEVLLDIWNNKRQVSFYCIKDNMHYGLCSFFFRESDIYPDTMEVKLIRYTNGYADYSETKHNAYKIDTKINDVYWIDEFGEDIGFVIKDMVIKLLT